MDTELGIVTAEHEFRDTWSLQRFVAGVGFAAALSFSIAPAYGYHRTALAKAIQRPSEFYSESDRTVHTVEVTVASASEDLMTEIDRIYDYLRERRVDLDDDSYRLLYSNLWDLYD
jgi:hypothetical protein